MCFALVTITLSSLRAEDCRTKTLFFTITKRAFIKLDGIIATLLYSRILHNFAKLSKLGFSLYLTHMYLKLSEAHNQNKGQGCHCCFRGRW